MSAIAGEDLGVTAVLGDYQYCLGDVHDLKLTLERSKRIHVGIVLMLIFTRMRQYDEQKLTRVKQTRDESVVVRIAMPTLERER